MSIHGSRSKTLLSLEIHDTMEEFSGMTSMGRWLKIELPRSRIEVHRTAFTWRPNKFNCNLMWLGLDIVWDRNDHSWSYSGDLTPNNYSDIKRRAI